MRAPTTIYRSLIRPAFFYGLAYVAALAAIKWFGMTSVFGWTVDPSYVGLAGFVAALFLISDKAADAGALSSAQEGVAQSPTNVANVPSGPALAQGIALHANGDFGEAIQVLTAPAQQGNAHAQRLIGEMIYIGLGCAKDHAKGRDWLMAAADNGDANAQYSVSVGFSDGHPGYVKDEAKGDAYLQMALAQEYPDAIAAMGLRYLHGLGTTAKDLNMAKSLLTRAAEMGSGLAQTTLDAIAIGLFK